MLRSLRYVLLTAVLLGFAAGAAAQPAVRFTAFGVGDGLSQSSVYAVTRDARGFLWAGTHDGLNRFDGHDFVAFYHDADDPRSLSHDRIVALLPDDAGGLWVLTRAGLDRLEARSGRFARFGPAGSAPGEEQNALAPRRAGGLWVGTQRGLYHFDPASARFVRVAETPQVLAIVEDSGRAWLGTREGLRRLDGDSLAVPERLPEALRTQPVRALHLDRWGGLWAGAEAGLFHREPGADAFRAVWPGRAVVALAEDSAGHIWAGATAGGLARIDPASGRAEPLAGGPLVQSLWADPRGLVWVGTDGAGVLRADPRPPKFTLERFGPEGAAEDFVRAIAEDAEGALWIGSLGGLRRRDPATGRWRTFRHGATRGLPSDDARALLADRHGTLWAGTTAGLAAYDGRGGFQPHVLPVAEATITDLLETRDGTLWVATRSGLFFRQDDGTFARAEAQREDERRWVSSSTKALAEDRRGRLWVGFYSDMLYACERPGPPGLLGPCHEVALGGIVTGLAEDRQGRMWAGTHRGLVRIDPDGATRRFDERDGLPSAFVYFLLEDAEGRMWAGTNRGLVRFDPRAEDPTFRGYSPEDGLQSNEFNTHAALAASDGTLYVGGVAGMNAFTLASVRDDPEAPAVAFTQFKRFDEPADLGFDLNALDTLRLDWRRDAVFSFAFAGLDLADPERVRYAYQMEDVDPAWVDAGRRREARYTRLAPGRYAFRVRAANADGVWGPERRLVVEIPPPFWRAGWFLALGGLGALGAVAGSVRAVSLRKLRRRLAALEAQRALEAAVHAERARISADVHDHVGATLTRIQLLSDLARRGRGAGHLDRIAEAARAATRDLDAIVWAVNPDYDRLDSFADYLCDYAGEFCEAADLACRFERPEPWPEGRLPAEVRYPAFLAFKEALANAARHAEATTIRLRFVASEGEVRVEVIDDGLGFAPGATGAFSNGLRTMRARAEAAGGRLAVESAPGAGTRVRIVLPLRAASPT